MCSADSTNSVRRCDAKVTNAVGAGCGQFVQLTRTVHNEGSAAAQLLQHAGKHLGQRRVVDTQQLRFCACRVGQRSQDIKDGADTQFAARADGVAHGGMEIRRKEKADADFVNRLRYSLRR